MQSRKLRYFIEILLLIFYVCSTSASEPIPAAPIPAMVVDAKGNVGVGTDKPQAKLDINGDIRISAKPYPAPQHQLVINTDVFLIYTYERKWKDLMVPLQKSKLHVVCLKGNYGNLVILNSQYAGSPIAVGDKVRVTNRMSGAEQFGIISEVIKNEPFSIGSDITVNTEPKLNGDLCTDDREVNANNGVKISLDPGKFITAGGKSFTSLSILDQDRLPILRVTDGTLFVRKICNFDNNKCINIQ